MADAPRSPVGAAVNASAVAHVGEPAQTPADHAPADAAPHANRPVESEVSVIGRALLQAMYAASRLGALWGFESKLAEEALQNLSVAIRNAAAAHGDLTIRFANDLAYLNENRLRVDFSGYAAFKHVHDRAARHGVGEITIRSEPAKRDLIEAFRVLESKPAAESTADEHYEAARAGLDRAAVATVGFGPVMESDGHRGKLGPVDVRQAATQAYLRLVFVAKQSLAAIDDGRRLDARRCRRAVHDVIDVLQRGESLMLALSQVKNYSSYGACHAANVCVLACAMGLRNGLHKLLVADLGVAALLHEPVARDDAADDVAPACDRAAAHALLPQLGFTDGALRGVLVARDLRAPAADAHGVAPLFQRIVRVACFADNQTTPAGPGRPARSFDEVVSVMERDSGAHFDPALVRSLRAALGSIPFGTIVKLRSGERAVLCARHPDAPDPLRGVARIFEDARGLPADDGRQIDLSERHAETGDWVHDVVSLTPPCHAFARPSDFVRIL